MVDEPNDINMSERSTFSHSPHLRVDGQDDYGEHRVENHARSQAVGSPWDRFRPLPAQVLRDERLKSHHVDVLLAKLEFTDIPSTRHRASRAPLREHRSLTTSLLGNFTRINRSNLATYLRELQEFGYLVLDYDGKAISGIRWNTRDTALVAALRRNTLWVRMPVPIIHDVTLAPRERHAYAALQSHESYRRNRAKRKFPDELPPYFHCTNGLLATLMQVSQATGKRALWALRDLHLIEYIEGPTLKGARPMVFVPLNVRYGTLVAPHGALANQPKFFVHPKLEDSVTYWRAKGRPENHDLNLSSPTPL